MSMCSRGTISSAPNCIEVMPLIVNDYTLVRSAK